MSSCIADGSVEVTIALTVAGCPMRSSFEDQVQRFVGAVEGVTAVRLHFDVMSPDEKAALSSRLRGGRPEKTISLSPTTRVLAIASGKGGVGKSTLTANLAAALAARGERVGVLDADVYGHSIPHMLGVQQRPVVVDTMIVPPVRGDLKLMSIGFFLDDNSPGDVARADAASCARAVPLATSTGATSTRSSSTCRPAPATWRSRSASCCRARRS